MKRNLLDIKLHVYTHRRVYRLTTTTTVRWTPIQYSIYIYIQQAIHIVSDRGVIYRSPRVSGHYLYSCIKVISEVINNKNTPNPNHCFYQFAENVQYNTHFVRDGATKCYWETTLHVNMGRDVLLTEHGVVYKYVYSAGSVFSVSNVVRKCICSITVGEKCTVSRL